MKKIVIVCIAAGFTISSMDNPFNKKQLDKKMSPGLYALKYGFTALLEKEEVKPVEFSTITIVKNRDNTTEISTNNFFIFSSRNEIVFSPKKKYSSIHTIKTPMKFTSDDKKFPVLYSNINTIISSARKTLEIGELQYYKVNSDLIHHIEEHITK